MTEAKAPRVFTLIRYQDVTGVSGDGMVAHGVQFADGTVVLRWNGEHASTVVWGSLDDAMAIHGHDGLTRVAWLDLAPPPMSGDGGDFPSDSSEVGWDLLTILATRPHPLLLDVDETGLHFGVVEVLHEAKVVHHLLDMIGVPHGLSVDTRDIDARTLLAVRGFMGLRERLDRIAGWHERETGPAGTVGDFCVCCGDRWPCDTRQMADGTYQDEPAGVPGNGWD